MTRDTVFDVASMVKVASSPLPIVGALVEAGKLRLNDPVPNIDPALGAPQVLTGYNAAGARNCGRQKDPSRCAISSRTSRVQLSPMGCRHRHAIST